MILSPPEPGEHCWGGQIRWAPVSSNPSAQNHDPNSDVNSAVVVIQNRRNWQLQNLIMMSYCLIVLALVGAATAQPDAQCTT